MEEDLNNVDLLYRPSGSKYVSAIDHIADRSLSFVLVDVKRRLETALKSIEKVEPGGIFILDDANRYIPATEGEWVELSTKLEKWLYIPMTDGVTRTDIWMRPF